MSKSTCSIDGCDKPYLARGLCSMHYKRARRLGDPGEASVRKPGPTPQLDCKVQGCPKAFKAKGFCEMHYSRWVRHREVGSVEPQVQLDAPKACTAEQCNAEHAARGWCKIHHQRWLRWGDPLAVHSPLRGEESPKWIGDKISYGPAHARIRSAYGPAKSHKCIDCGDQARDWSYNHNDPNEKLEIGISAKPVAYSADPLYYSPRCRSCHSLFDSPRKEAHHV